MPSVLITGANLSPASFQLASLPASANSSLSVRSISSASLLVSWSTYFWLPGSAVVFERYWIGVLEFCIDAVGIRNK